jgi:hypothetical protein
LSLKLLFRPLSQLSPENLTGSTITHIDLSSTVNQKRPYLFGIKSMTTTPNKTYLKINPKSKIPILTSPQILLPGNLLLNPMFYFTAERRLFMFLANCIRTSMNNVGSVE